MALIVDGEAEYRSLPRLLRNTAGPHVIVGTFRADIQPFAPSGQMARAVASRLPLLRSRHCDTFIVVVDRETRDVCPGALAEDLLAALHSFCGGGLQCAGVVIKDRTFENWLLSDPDAFAGMQSRFRFPDAVIRTVRNGCADRLAAIKVIKEAAQKRSYSKVQDAVRILERASVARMGQHSRSFRKFLRALGDPDYAQQSKVPAG